MQAGVEKGGPKPSFLPFSLPACLPNPPGTRCARADGRATFFRCSNSKVLLSALWSRGCLPVGAACFVCSCKRRPLLTLNRQSRGLRFLRHCQNAAVRIGRRRSSGVVFVPLLLQLRKAGFQLFDPRQSLLQFDGHRVRSMGVIELRGVDFLPCHPHYPCRYADCR